MPTIITLDLCQRSHNTLIPTMSMTLKSKTLWRVQITHENTASAIQPWYKGLFTWHAGRISIFYEIYFTCPSVKEPKANFQKGDVPLEINTWKQNRKKSSVVKFEWSHSIPSLSVEPTGDSAVLSSGARGGIWSASLPRGEPWPTAVFN